MIKWMEAYRGGKDAKDASLLIQFSSRQGGSKNKIKNTPQNSLRASEDPLVCPRHGLEAASRRSRATIVRLTTGGLGVAEGGWETAVSGSSHDLRTQKWHSYHLALSVGFAC